MFRHAMLSVTMTMTMALLLAGVPAADLAAAENGSVLTYFTILVGFPSGTEAASGGVLLVPGTVIPIAGASSDSTSDRQQMIERSISFTTVVDKLWSTFRLDPSRKWQTATYQAAKVDQQLSLPCMASGVTISATLLGYNDSTGTYRIVFQQGDRALADSTVNVDRGGRAVVGGMDGAEAPYLFVFIEPDPPKVEDGKFRYRQGIGITEPAKREAPSPRYPDSARRDRVSGVVVLDLKIDSQGKVVDHVVLKDPDPRLTEAAKAAVLQWVFEPARNAEGTPLTVWYVITVRFNLK
jgi:TonB family protein